MTQPDYGTPDLIGAWIMDQLWERKPRWMLRAEMASAALPIEVDQASFDSATRVLVLVGLIDQKFRLTSLGREARAHPTPEAIPYCERFRQAIDQLDPVNSKKGETASIKSRLIREFSDLVYRAEATRRRLS